MKLNYDLILKHFALSRRIKNSAAVVIGVGFLLTSFQNCSPGFLPNRMGLSSVGDFSLTSAGRFAEAKAVLQQRCISCHSGSTATSFNLLSDKEFVDSGLVSPGSPSRSKLIYRLRNYPTDMGAPRDMPKSSGAISSNEYSILKNWVESMSNPNTTNPFACSENEAPDALNAQRLTRLELRNLFFSVVSTGIDRYWANGQMVASDTGTPPTVTKWMDNNFLNIYNNLPPDASSTYSTADSNFTALHAQAYYGVADQLTQFVTQGNTAPNFVGNYIKFSPGSCAYSGDPNNLSPACQTAFVKNLVLRAWGREVETDDTNGNNELASLMQEFSLTSGLPAVNNVIFRVFMAPQFYFHLNTSVIQSGPYYRLTSYAIARRLSYIFTQGPPDEQLLSIAGSQDLSTDAGFNAALDYLSSNMNSSVTQFTQEWLKLDSLPKFRNTSYDKFQYLDSLYEANFYNPNGDLAGFRSGETYPKVIREEIQELVRYITNSNQGLKDLFNTNISFARDPMLMRVYNVTAAAPSEGTLNESNAVRFPAGERSGLLTRAGMLFAGSETENPMHRGVSIRKNFFCKSIAPPPPNLPGAGSLAPQVGSGYITTREHYTEATSASACMGCHSLINPVGFAFSKYNAFGGFQALEPVKIDRSTDTNNVTHYSSSVNLPTDAYSSLDVALNINKNVDGGVQFSDAISDATDVKSCLTQNFYTFESGLPALPGPAPSCAMNRMYQALDSHSSLKEFFRASVLVPNFRYRNIQK